VIAAAAGVSPALVIHHFGSKEGLREACDERMWQILLETKASVLMGDQRAGLLGELARMDEYGPMAGYIVRSLRAGGESARRFIESYIQPSADFLAALVDRGLARPSANPEAMAKFVVMQAMGLYLAYSILHPEATGGSDIVHGLMGDIGVPMLEIYTHGLLTDSTLLDAYTAAVPPTTPTTPTPPTPADKDPQP
jgi:AcrR family transcriptional regulator